MDLPTIGEHLSVFVTKFVHARAQKLLYFRASGQNSDIAVVFSDPDFLYGTDIMAIDGHLPCDLDL